MNTHSLLKMFHHTTLVIVLAVSTQLYANTVVDQVIAVVDNSAILKSDLDQAVFAVQQQLQSQNQAAPPLPILRRDVLDQLILRQAQLEQVKRFGVRPDETALNAAVLSIAKQQGVESLGEFQKLLDQKRAGSYAALRTQVADELNINRLRQQQVMSRIKVSDRDIDNFLKSPQGQATLGGQVHTLHLRVTATSESVSQSELLKVATALKQALANSNDIQALTQQFSTERIKVQGTDTGSRTLADIPADLAARLSGLSVGQTTEIITAADGLHVLKLLERTAGEKKALVTQYFTRHILIQPSEVVSPEDAKQHIDQIYQRLKQGANFAELASTYSTDTGSGRDGGSLGWVVLGTMVPEFEKTMTTIPVGQISQPFQTQYGWHILTVENQRQVDMTEEYQRRMAKQILGERQFDAEVDSWLREVRANAYVDIKDSNLKN